jgi:hypothetical protein
MSYALAGPLQAAIYQMLAADSALDALVGGRSMTGCPPAPSPRPM